MQIGVDLLKTKTDLPVLSSMQDTNENPFVTTTTKIPMQKVPFPAVSVSSYASFPKKVLLLAVLNNAVFDCYGVEKEEDCHRSEALVAIMGPDLTFRISEAFGTLHSLFRNYTSSIGADEVGGLWLLLGDMCGRIHARAPRDWGAFLANVSAHLEPGRAFAAFENLAMGTFREANDKILSQMLKMSSSAAGNSSTSPAALRAEECPLALLTMEPEVFHSLAAWVYFQGTERPKIRAGDILRYGWWFQDHWADAENRRHWEETLRVALQALQVDGGGGDFSANDVYSFVLPENHQLLPVPGGSLWNCTLNEADAKPSCQPPVTSQPCCDLERAITSNYRQALKHLKYDMLPPLEMERRSCKEDVSRALELLDFGGAPNSSQMVFTDDYYQSAVPTHQFRGSVDHQGLASRPRSLLSLWFSLSRSLTYSFNTAPFWEVFRETPMTRAMYDEVHAKEEDAKGRPGLFYPASNGPEFGFEAFVQAKQSGEDSAILVSVHNPGEIPGSPESSFEVRGGRSYTFVVRPRVTVTDEAVRRMDRAERDCQLPEESGNLTLFRRYSFSHCAFECRMRRAREASGCVPWAYPRTEDARGLPICHRAAEWRFYAAANRPVLASECSCLHDCDATEYEVVDVMAKDSDFSDLCVDFFFIGIDVSPWKRLEPDERLNVFAETKFFFDAAHVSPADGVSYLVDNLTTSLLHDYIKCHTIAQSMSHIKVYVAPSKVTVTKRSLRVTFSDQVANFGIIVRWELAI